METLVSRIIAVIGRVRDGGRQSNSMTDACGVIDSWSRSGERQSHGALYQGFS
jgi:hypothetical protein